VITYSRSSIRQSTPLGSVAMMLADLTSSLHTTANPVYGVNKIRLTYLTITWCIHKHHFI